MRIASSRDRTATASWRFANSDRTIRIRVEAVYAALNVQNGEVQGKTTARQTSRDFVGSLGEVVATREPDEEIHVILGNLSARKTKLVAVFLGAHLSVTLHCTPTFSSWLHQVASRMDSLSQGRSTRGLSESSSVAGCSSRGAGIDLQIEETC